jgi:predicted transposase/invertase (TIGR01784 family)
MKQFLNPRNDWMFKQIFGSERNKDVLIGFLNAVFEGVHDPIEEVEFLSPHQNSAIGMFKESIVDITCTDTKNRKFIVEMQCYNDPHFLQRACVYSSRAYADQLIKQDKNDGSNEQGYEQAAEDNEQTIAEKQKAAKKAKELSYEQLKPVIFLAILSNYTLSNADEYISHNKILDIKTHVNHIKEFSYSFIELDHFNKSFEESQTVLDKWCYFFKNAQVINVEDLDEIKNDYPLISKAYDTLAFGNLTPEEFEEYWHSELDMNTAKSILWGAEQKGKAEGLAEGIEIGKAEGEAKGKAEGLAEGEYKKAREMALAMLEDGTSIEKVSLYTKLPVEEVQKLLKEPRGIPTRKKNWW